jgi:Immunity protein 8
MIQAKIKWIEITDAPDLDPAKYTPEDAKNFGCTFGLKIGPHNSEGEELFYVTACTPSWLAKACAKDGFVWGRHHLVVQEFDLAAIRSAITKFVERCSGESWKEVAAKVNRIAAWEFEDYEG